MEDMVDVFNVFDIFLGISAKTCRTIVILDVINKISMDIGQMLGEIIKDGRIQYIFTHN